MKFSVVVIARNEEKTLPRLLKSVQGVDEIIVVDTGSTDNTVKVAKEYGARVEEVGDRFIVTATKEMEIDGLVREGQKAFNFAEARNYAHSLAQNDMIFMPDCDEYVEWDLENIPEADRLEYPFYFSMDDNDNPIIQFNHSKFYNHTKYKWVRLVHEVLQGQGETKLTDKILLKHRQNTETNRSQYLIGLAMDYYLNGYNDRNMHYLARELYYKGKYDEAIRFFRKHIENIGWETEKGQSYIFIGDCYNKLGFKEQAIENYLHGFAKDINRREGLISAADVHYHNKNWAEAAKLYEMCLLIGKNSYYGNYECNYADYPHAQLSVCLYWLGDKEKSLKHLKQALEYAPNNEIYNNNLKFYGV